MYSLTLNLSLVRANKENTGLEERNGWWTKKIKEIGNIFYEKKRMLGRSLVA